MVELVSPVGCLFFSFDIFLREISNSDGGALKRDMKTFLGPAGNASGQLPRRHAIGTIYSRAT